MERISSRSTFFTKRVFPPLWFGGLAVFLVSAIVGMASGANVPIHIFVVPIVMAPFGYLVMKNTVLDLVDEVWDAGEELVVKNDGHEVRVALSDVVNLSYSVAVSPQRVTLSLRHPTVLGKEITFGAAPTWIPFGKNPIIVSLIERVDAARRRRP